MQQQMNSTCSQTYPSYRSLYSWIWLIWANRFSKVRFHPSLFGTYGAGGQRRGYRLSYSATLSGSVTTARPSLTSTWRSRASSRMACETGSRPLPLLLLLLLLLLPVVTDKGRTKWGILLMLWSSKCWVGGTVMLFERYCVFPSCSIWSDVCRICNSY